MRAALQALTHEADNAEALTGLGLSYKALGQLDEAQQAFSAVLRTSPGNALAIGNLAGALFDQGAPPLLRLLLLLLLLLWLLLRRLPWLLLRLLPLVLAMLCLDMAMHGGKSGHS